MGGGQLGVIVDLPTRRALALPLLAIPGGQAVLDAAVWDGRGGGRRGDMAPRAGRQQTGDQQTAQQRAHLCLLKSCRDDGWQQRVS